MVEKRQNSERLRAERDRTRRHLAEDWAALRASRSRGGRRSADAHAGAKPGTARPRLGAGAVLAAVIGFGLVIPRILARGRLPPDPPAR